MLRGVVIADHEAGFVIGLRQREACASKPVLAGHDIAAFELAGKEDVDALLALCDELGVQHGEIHDRGEYGSPLTWWTRTGRCCASSSGASSAVLGSSSA